MLKKKNQLPKITVITIVYNSEETIERTIKSVLSQSYSNLEYIIVYTPSQDKTFDIIKKYKTKIDKVILCEKRGIYLNMNVAIKSASGKYINFMKLT